MKMTILSLLTLCITYASMAQSHWESILLAEHDWSYLALSSEAPENWFMTDFDDSSWPVGPGGFGYADGDDATVTENVNSIYLRQSFQVDDTAMILDAVLDMDYDDAFVAWLNGVEIARSSNVLDDPPVYNSTVSSDHEALIKDGYPPERFYFEKEFFKEGRNVLAIQILNISTNSSDMSALPYLNAKISGSDLLYNPTPYWFSEPVSFTESMLPIVLITTNGQGIYDDPRTIAHMGIINKGGGVENSISDSLNIYNGRISIEVRGQSSQMFPKKSYSFETQDSLGENNNVSLLGMPAENDWILYAPYTDKSMLRNAVTFSLGAITGHYCSRIAFCELFVDDDYKGVYLLMEKIKRDEDRVNIATLLPGDNEGDELSGGYIFKVDKIDGDYVENYSGFKSQPQPSYPSAMDIIYQYFQPEPDELSTTQRSYLKEHILEAEAVLISPDFSDPEIGYNNYLNTSSFVDFMLINEISKEVDKYRYSSYFYKKKTSKGGEIFAGPIWDFNLGYGNVDYWELGLNTSGWLFEDVNPYDWSIIFWWKRLMDDQYFENLAATRWQYLREEQFSDAAINQLIDSLTTLLDEAKLRNYTRWPILGTYVWPNYDWENNTYEDEVDYFRSWILARLNWMDDNFSATILQPSVSIEKVSRTAEVLSCRIHLNQDQFTNKMLRSKYFDLVSSTEGLKVDSVYYINATTATINISAEDPLLLAGASMSLEIDEKILNGFRALTSNEVTVNRENAYARNSQIQVYAAGSRIYIYTDTPEDLPPSMKLLNLSGQVVGDFSLGPVSLNEIQAEVPDGIYIVYLKGEDHARTEKVILKKD